MRPIWLQQSQHFFVFGRGVSSKEVTNVLRMAVVAEDYRVWITKSSAAEKADAPLADARNSQHQFARAFQRFWVATCIPASFDF